MKNLFLTILLINIFCIGVNCKISVAQNNKVDSVRNIILKKNNESEIIQLYIEISDILIDNKSDSSLFYLHKAYEIASKIGDDKTIAKLV